MIKYLGSKKLLIPQLFNIIDPNTGSVFDAPSPKVRFLDVFSGTCRVGYALKQQGHKVVSNDIGTYAQTIARCYILGDHLTHFPDARDAIAEFNSLGGKNGWFTETYCQKSRFFQSKNGERIDAIRELIEARKYTEPLKSILLTSLMEAADKVDSTCGVQMAYLKQYADRSFKDLQLQIPWLTFPVDGCGVFGIDAKELGQHVGHVDVAYLDPPYNQHSYLGNYHIWESLVLWDKPEVYGVACKREDVKDRKSDFNFKGKIKSALKETIQNINATLYIVSFNDEGYLSEQDIVELLPGEVTIFRREYNRYVGARIGIHNLKGEEVGTVTHTENEELIFVARKAA